MNIYGYKSKLNKVNRELKKGERDLGTKRFNYLEKQKLCWKHKIENLRTKRKKK